MAWWDGDLTCFRELGPEEERPPGQEMSFSEECEDFIVCLDASAVEARVNIFDCFGFSVDVKEGENLAEVEELFGPTAKTFLFEKYDGESTETRSEWLYIPTDGTSLIPGLDGTCYLEEILKKAGFVHKMSENGRRRIYFRPGTEESTESKERKRSKRFKKLKKCRKCKLCKKCKESKQSKQSKESKD